MFNFFNKQNNKNIEDPLNKIAALLIHVAKIDENYAEKEKVIISDHLCDGIPECGPGSFFNLKTKECQEAKKCDLGKTLSNPTLTEVRVCKKRSSCLKSYKYDPSGWGHYEKKGTDPSTISHYLSCMSENKTLSTNQYHSCVINNENPDIDIIDSILNLLGISSRK